MVGIWCLSLWQDLGRPSHIRLVELGPGRGTLLADLLRGLSPFTDFLAALELHLVEARALQLNTNCLALAFACKSCTVAPFVVVGLKHRDS